MDKKRTVGFEDLRVLILPQYRGGGKLSYTLYCIVHCETVACLGATRQWRCETVACLGATRQCRAVFGCYKTVPCLDADGQCKC